MKRKITVSHKEYEMQKIDVDTYIEYLEISEKIDGKQRYSKADIEAMLLFIAKVYGNQFTVEELKDRETGVDAAGIILEFQFIEMSVAEEMERKMKKIQENFQNGK